jgi:hypothetical protein
MHINPEITAGQLIETFTIVLAVLGAARKVGQIETKLNIMYAWFEQVVLRDRRKADTMKTREFYGGD